VQGDWVDAEIFFNRRVSEECLDFWRDTEWKWLGVAFAVEEAVALEPVLVGLFGTVRSSV